MPRPNAYRDVSLPDQWDSYPDDAKVNYLASTMDRDQLLQRAGDLANLRDDEIGEQSFLKTGLAQLTVALEQGDEGDD